MGYAKPTIHPYSVPEDIREDCPPEEFDYEAEGYFNTNIYNFKEVPDYPTNLTSDENGHFDAESQAKYDKYEKEYDEWLRGNIYVFEDDNGNDPELPADLKKFIDDNNITYYTQIRSKDNARLNIFKQNDVCISRCFPQERWIGLRNNEVKWPGVRNCLSREYLK